MKVFSSKLSEKGQTTVPIEIRNLLKIKPGDQVFFQIEEGGKVALRRLSEQDFAWAASIENTLAEWTDPSDDDL